MMDRLVVSLDTLGGATTEVGEVFFTARAGRLVSSTFRYDAGYLASPAAFAIDPALPLQTSGAQNVTGLPGAMQDCSPDRWGRNLITKQRRGAALRDGRKPETLTDADLLVGVSDVTRQGALRFQAARDGEFLAAGTDVPKLLELPRLLRAADASTRDQDDFAAVKTLLDAGSGSLGGARPKASVRDGERLLIAKFPHPDDQWDVMAWEKTTLDLAAAAGIRVPVSSLVKVDGRSVLLVDRFDRKGPGRIPYISAMTLLEAHDGESHDYAEIAETLPEVSSATTADLNELWRRIAFSVMVNNTDDHLRNHGFLRERGGWRLSPAFDMNPNPDSGVQRQTGVGGAYDREAAIDSLRRSATEFGLSPATADAVRADVASPIATWRDVASRHGLGAGEQARFADAFWIPD
jgi:serine/threonine-protein kinase HipA